MFISKTVYEELLNRIDALEKQVERGVKDAKMEYSDAIYKVEEEIRNRFIIIDRYIKEVKEDNAKRIDNRIDNQFEKLEYELDSKIEKSINDLNIEDKVLLKVVKATFNNWNYK